MKTLHLLRHAKSDWGDPTLDDHDRPLNGRGRKARKLIAQHVQGWPVDLVVCSTAVRARQTAEPVVAALGCPVRYEDAIYEGVPSELLGVVQQLPDHVSVALLVGHNPGFEDLTRVLCGATPPYPTAALGTIELAVDHWRDAEPRAGRLRAQVTPADLKHSS